MALFFERMQQSAQKVFDTGRHCQRGDVATAIGKIAGKQQRANLAQSCLGEKNDLRVNGWSLQFALRAKLESRTRLPRDD
jgi:hypothetical protein